jgi:hypothetical protein
MGVRNTKLCDYANTPNDHFIAKPITTPEITTESFEVSPGLLNLITREQFGGSPSEDASMHLHDSCEICDMQNLKMWKTMLLNLNYSHFQLEEKLKNAYYHYLLLVSILGMILKKLS